MAGAETVQVEVVYCAGPGQVDAVALQLPQGCSAGAAVQASGLVLRHGLQEQELRLGIWCKACAPETPLREHDRVEIYRALSVDPKEARRLRYRRHRERQA